MKKYAVQLFGILLLTQLFACGGGSSPTPEPPPTPTPNVAPTANAGSDQTVDELVAVTLDGSASSDSDGTISSYQWTQTAGTSVTLTNATSASASFTGPDVTADETLTFELTVTDNDGATSTDSMAVTVQRVNSAPTADAGNDQSVDEQTSVTLLGEAEDADGTIATYLWAQASGTSVTLADANTISASFTSPTLTQVETLSFTFTVTDNDGATTSDTIDIDINPVNVAPTADAGANQTVNQSVTVTLNGTGSADSDGSISTYQWSQTAGTTVTLTNATSTSASFTSPMVSANESFTFDLTVTDNEGASNTASVTVTVTSSNSAPTADAGVAQFSTSSETVTLDASASTDAESGIDYSWLQTDTTGITITLNDINVAQPTFTAPSLTAAKTFIFEVTVTDTGSLFDTATVNIAVQPIITQKLNDTGAFQCGDYAYGASGSGEHGNMESCEDTTDSLGDVIPDGQDAEYGRDLSASDGSDGTLGFSFTKLDANGDPLPQSATEWSCVLDNVTQLIWEVKTSGTDLLGRNNLYSWYNTDTTTNGGDEGTQNGGSCTVGDCDTQAYVASVNALNGGVGLCGANDWKMPTKEELRSTLDYSLFTGSKVDTAYFPRTNSGNYWSSTPQSDNTLRAYAVSFGFANDSLNDKVNGIRVRLVRNKQ